MVWRKLREREKGYCMRACIRQAAALVLGGLALGVLVFFLFFTGMLTLVPAAAGGIVFFTLVSVIAAAAVLTLTAGVLQAERTPALADAWLCCGELSVVGGLGALLTSLLTSLTVSLEVGLFVGVAVTFFFLVLLFGGLICFLRRYVTARFHCGC